MRRSSFRAEAPSLWVTFDASGRFAAIDGQDRTTQVVDLVTGDPVGPPIAAADAGPELGFLRAPGELCQGTTRPRVSG
jgi:hypothetical protein